MSTEPPTTDLELRDGQPQLTVGSFAAPAAPRSAAGRGVSPSTERLKRVSRDAVRLAVAAPSLLLPLAWPFVALLLRLVVASRRRIAGDQPVSEVGAITGVLIDGLGRLRKRGVPTTLGLIVRAAIRAGLIAAVLSAGIPALFWLAEHGTSGLLVSVRAGIRTWAVPVLSTALSWRILQDIPTVSKGSTLGRASDSVLLGTIGLAVTCVAVVAFAFPRAPWFPAGSFYGLTSVLPAASKDGLRTAESDLVEAEAKAVVRCLADNGRDIGWQVLTPDRKPNGKLVLTVDRGALPSAGTTRRDNSVLALALQNQLPSAVSRIVLLRNRSFEPLVIERDELSGRGPTTDVKGLAKAAGVEGSVLPTSDRVVEEALACGAAHL